MKRPPGAWVSSASGRLTGCGCAIHCKKQSETMDRRGPLLGALASDSRVVARRATRRHGRRVADPLLELAQAFFELSAGERADVSIDDLCQFGGLGCRQLAGCDRSGNACHRFDTV